MSKTHIRLLISISLFLIFFYPSHSFAAESSNYILDPSIITSAGYPEESANFCFLEITLGEVVGGETSGAAYNMEIGYINIISAGAPANLPPVLDAIGDKTVSEGATLTFAVTASDPDEDSLTYSASNLPPGAVFNAGMHIFTWSPNYTQSGVYPGVHFKVTDGSFVDTEDITVTVNNVNRPPILSAIGNKTVAENQLLQFVITATDPDTGAGLTYSASNLPPEAIFDPLTRTFSWIPASGQSGIYTGIHFEVSDGLDMDSEDITIVVGDTAPPDFTITFPPDGSYIDKYGNAH